jgi:hypothetical protein
VKEFELLMTTFWFRLMRCAAVNTRFVGFLHSTPHLSNCVFLAQIVPRVCVCVRLDWETLQSWKIHSNPKSDLGEARDIDNDSNAEIRTAERIHTADDNILVSFDELCKQ